MYRFNEYEYWDESNSYKTIKMNWMRRIEFVLMNLYFYISTLISVYSAHGKM